MRIQINRRFPLVGIPSASGIAATPRGLYVVGDDSPWLYGLDGRFRIAGRIRIHPAEPAAGTLRIARDVKPDFEALASRTGASGTELFAFGSGSRPHSREVLAHVQDVGAAARVTLHDTAAYCAAIRREAVLEPAALNIEGAVIREQALFLFNRGANCIAQCPLDALLAHLQGHAPCPTPRIHRFRLPTLAGREAGFSGATLLPGTATMLFTASVELTDDWNVDGAVAGSFLGALSLPFTAQDGQPRCALLCDAEDRPLPIKVESVTVLDAPAPRSYRLLMTTDSDDGNSELIEATLTMG